MWKSPWSRAHSKISNFSNPGPLWCKGRCGGEQYWASYASSFFLLWHINRISYVHLKKKSEIEVCWWFHSSDLIGDNPSIFKEEKFGHFTVIRNYCLLIILCHKAYLGTIFNHYTSSSSLYRPFFEERFIHSSSITCKLYYSSCTHFKYHA